MQARDEDDARHTTVEQHLHVLVLVHSTGHLGAEHRRVTALGQGALDHLGEGGEDRVGELGRDESHETSALGPQPARAVVTEHVERGEHRQPGRLGHPRFAVQHPRDRGLGHAGVGPDVAQSCLRHSHVVTARDGWRRRRSESMSILLPPSL